MVYEKQKEKQCGGEVAEISAMPPMKQGGDAAPHVHGPDCGHLH
jgi:hypothetical protein